MKSLPNDLTLHHFIVACDERSEFLTILPVFVDELDMEQLMKQDHGHP